MSIDMLDYNVDCLGRKIVLFPKMLSYYLWFISFVNLYVA